MMMKTIMAVRIVDIKMAMFIKIAQNHNQEAGIQHRVRFLKSVAQCWRFYQSVNKFCRHICE